MSRTKLPCPGTSELPCRERCATGEGCTVRSRMLPGVLPVAVTGGVASADVVLSSTRLTTGGDKRGYVDAVALAWHDVTCPDALDCDDRAGHAAVATLARSGVLDRFLTRLAELGRQHA